MIETYIPRSTNIAKVDYDSDAQVMTITFQSGGAWKYTGVPVGVFQGIQGASSAGSYFHRNIKNRYAETEV